MTAPWGFGKSALLSAWERTLGASGLLRVALSPQDQRPRDVLQQLASSPQRRSGHHSERGRDTTLVRALGRRDAVIAFSGIDAVSDKETVALIHDLVIDDPQERTIVLVGSHVPDWDWPRIRRTRRVVELGPTDLRLDIDDVLSNPAAQHLERRGAQRLVHLVGGWSAGVTAGLAQAELGGPGRDNGPEIDLAVQDFVRHTVVEALPKEALSSLSILAATGDLPAATDAQHLDDAIPLVMPGERPGAPPSLAPALRDVLISSAIERDPDGAAAFIESAIDARRVRHDPVGVLRLATRFHRSDILVDELTDHGVPLLFAGHSGVVADALDAIPVSNLVSSAALLHLSAAMSVLRSSVAEAAHWMTLADALRPASTPYWDTGGEGPASLIHALLETEGRPVTVPAVGPDAAAIWQGLSSTLAALDLLRQGDIARADGLLAAASRFTISQPVVELHRLTALALVQRARGDDREWEARLSDAERFLAQARLEAPTPLLLHAQLALRSFRRRELDAAERGLASVMAGLRLPGPWLRSVRLISGVMALEIAEGLGQTETAVLIRVTNSQLLRLEPPLRFPPPLLGRETSDPTPLPATSIRLSPAELRILQRLAGPHPVPRIAAALHVSAATVRSHIRSIYRKLGVSTRSDAVEVGRRQGLLD
ncbi:MAG: hypothetical protein KBB39_00010 [Phycicoccus sp.]|nr:hypothetical protein [Phycicoccus sp.]